MWWLIKGSFWFSLVLIALSLFGTATGNRPDNAPSMDVADAFTAATGAYSYISNICTDKPDVCEKGARTFTALGYRAKEGARIAFAYLDTKFADKPGSALASEGTRPADLKQALAANAASKPADRPTAPAFSATTTLTALLSTAAEAEKAVTSGPAAQPMPGKPAPYRPPVADRLLTGTVTKQTLPGGNPLAHIPVPLPRPDPDA